MSAGEKDGVPRIPSGEHRANPLSVLVEALKMTWGLVVLVAFGLAGDFFAGDAGALRTLAMAAAAIFAAFLLLGFVIWRARTWELADEGLVVRWGLLNRRRLTVPYEHIHTVSMNSTLFERVFGLVTLDLDTGAAATEGDASKISGLREGEAEALRSELFRRKRAAAPADEKNPEAPDFPDAPEAERPLAVFTLTSRQLALAAASHISAGGQAFALVVLLGNGLTQLGEWGLFDLEGAGAGIAAAEVPALLPLLAGFVVSVLALGAVVSFAVNLMRYAGYRVERYADRMVVVRACRARSLRDACSTWRCGRASFASSSGMPRSRSKWSPRPARRTASPRAACFCTHSSVCTSSMRFSPRSCPSTRACWAPLSCGVLGRSLVAAPWCARLSGGRL